jgi:hypothetical protein
MHIYIHIYIYIYTYININANEKIYVCKYRGFLDVRFVRASRGNVIRGIDAAVQEMSLGETADIQVSTFAYYLC